MLLEDKNAVIYGAGGAIGATVARAFASEGAKVFLAGRTLSKVEAVAKEITSTGGVAEAAQVDALDEQAVEQHINAVAGRAEGIDVLFNAIGMDDIQGTPLLDMPLEDVARPVVKAMRTQFLTARAVARRMAERGSGVILSITVPPTPVPFHGGYGVHAPRSKDSGGSSRPSLGHMASAWSSFDRPGPLIRPISTRRSNATPRPRGSHPRSS